MAGRIFQWRRRKANTFFAKEDVSELLGAVRDGNRMSALRKAVMIIDRSVNDLPAGIHKQTPTEFPFEENEMGKYADDLEKEINKQFLAHSKEGLTQRAKRVPTAAQVQAYEKQCEQFNKLQEEAIALKDATSDADKKKLERIQTDLKAVEEKTDKFDADFPDHDTEADAKDKAKEAAITPSVEQGVGVVPWVLIFELVMMVIKIIRDIREERKKTQPA